MKTCILVMTKYILYTCSRAAEMFRYPNFIFDWLNFHNLVQSKISDIGAYSFYYEMTLLLPKFIVALVPMTRTID